MGKGKNGCASGAMADPQVEVMEARERWYPFFQARLRELIDQAGMVDPEPAHLLFSQALLDFSGGEGGPWASDHLDLFRERLARLVALEEEDPDTAIKLLSEIDPQRAAAVLAELRDQETDPGSRAQYGSAIASLLFEAGRYAEARQELQAQAEDEEIPERYRSLTQAKLDALGAASGPQSELARLVPAEIREEGGVFGAYAEALEYQTPAGTEGHVAAASLVHEMSDRGFHRNACELARHLVEAQKEGSKVRESDEGIYARALEMAGRFDEAIAINQALADREGRSSDTELMLVAELYEKAGLRDQAIEAARRRRDVAPIERLGAAQEDLSVALAKAGLYEEAMDEVSSVAGKLGRRAPDIRAQVLQVALESQSDRDIRSDLREALSEQLLEAGRVFTALSELEDDISEGGLSPERIKSHQQKMAVIEEEINRLSE